MGLFRYTFVWIIWHLPVVVICPREIVLSAEQLCLQLCSATWNRKKLRLHPLECL